MIFAAGGLVAARPLRREAAAQQAPRRGAARLGAQGPAHHRRHREAGALPVVGSCFKFKPYGKSGLRMSELFREMGDVRRRHVPGALDADRSRAARGGDVDPVHRDRMQLGRPSWGSWVTYALGSENKDLPEFVVMLSGTRDGGSPPHPRMWHNGYLAGPLPGLPVPRRQGAGVLRRQPRRRSTPRPAGGSSTASRRSTNSRPRRPATRK